MQNTNLTNVTSSKKDKIVGLLQSMKATKEIARITGIIDFLSEMGYDRATQKRPEGHMWLAGRRLGITDLIYSLPTTRYLVLSVCSKTAGYEISRILS
ncbi:hypothetical protein TNCV_1485461 [Trichonephila clavipes]|nr:hypothetical protein TNCV_1485461 [Trichonephila clavipes]